MLRYLFNFFFPFLMLSFAAGATVGDVGIGGGDGGDADTSDSGDTTDTGDSSAGDEETADGTLDNTSADTEDTEPQVIDPDAPVDLGDGRQVPGKFKKLFDLAKKAGLEKEAKQLYFANQRLSKAIPGGINAAIEMAKTVENLGGVDGIEQLQGDLELYGADADLFESNPSKWVETGFTENPEAAMASFVASLAYVSEKHPEQYNHLMAKVVVNDIANLDVREIYRALAGIKDNPQAAQLAKQLADYYNSRVEASQKAPEQKPDAKNNALTDREKQVEVREMGVRFKEVNRGAEPALRASVTKALTAEAKANGVDLQKLSKEYPGEWRDLLNDIHQRIMGEARKDNRFLDKYYALVKKGDIQRATQAINQKHDRILESGTVVRDAVKERGLFRKKTATAKPGDKKGAAGTDNVAQNQGWQRVSKRPENSQINWSKTTQSLQLDGKYILNDGKKVIVNY